MSFPFSLGTPTPEPKKATKDYAPSKDYHPTMVYVRCRRCKSGGIAEFKGGFNLTDGDRLMAGKVIRGDCESCHRSNVELIPIGHLGSKGDDRTGLIHQIQKDLDAVAARGEQLTGAAPFLMPEARRKLYDRA